MNATPARWIPTVRQSEVDRVSPAIAERYAADRVFVVRRSLPPGRFVVSCVANTRSKILGAFPTRAEALDCFRTAVAEAEANRRLRSLSAGMAEALDHLREDEAGASR